MNKVYACIDGRSHSAAVMDWGIWSAQRLALPLEFLHVLERHPERAPLHDYSGAIGLGAQDALLQQLSALDAQRATLAQEAGRGLLAAARARANAAGLAPLDDRLRQGELVDVVLDTEPDARLFVLGEHHRAAGSARLHLDHHLERVIRAVQRPVLVATTAQFTPPQRVVLAFDGSATAGTTVAMVARSPLLAGLPVLLAMAAAPTTAARDQLAQAQRLLASAGFAAETALLPGEPEAVLPELVHAQGAALLVMGAYGHSRIRQLIVGSTTTTLLRTSQVPVLVLR